MSETGKLMSVDLPQLVRHLTWVAGPARGGPGTAGTHHSDGYGMWWDGDLLLVIVETAGGREISLVRVSADGDQCSMNNPNTGDDDFEYSPQDVSWWADLSESLPNVKALIRARKESK